MTAVIGVRGPDQVTLFQPGLSSTTRPARKVNASSTRRVRPSETSIVRAAGPAACGGVITTARVSLTLSAVAARSPKATWKPARSPSPAPVIVTWTPPALEPSAGNTASMRGPGPSRRLVAKREVAPLASVASAVSARAVPGASPAARKPPSLKLASPGSALPR